MILTGLVMGVFYSITLLVLFSYIGIRRICHYMGFVDFALTGFMLMLSFGSVTGLITTGFAGILISIELRIARWYYGTEHFDWDKGWIRVPPKRHADTPGPSTEIANKAWSA